MTHFAELIKTRSGHEEIMFALCSELGAEPPDGARELIARLAANLDIVYDDPLVELASVAAVVRENFEVRAKPILLSQVLLSGRGEADTLTILGAMTSHRAGLDVDVVSNGERLFLAHKRIGPPFVADVARDDPLFDGASLGVDLVWQCGHETAFAVLRRVARQAAHTGDIATELAALALLLALPLSAGSRDAFEAHHKRLLARLN